MEFLRDVASFWTFLDQPPFILYVGDEEYFTIEESVLSLRFQLLESTCLLKGRSLMRMEMFLGLCMSHVRPTTTERGMQYRVGAGSYIVIGIESHFSVAQASILSPKSFSSFEHRICGGVRGQLPPIPEVPECSLLELSFDDDSITSTMLLKSDSNGRIVIVSSPIDLENEATHPCNASSLQCNGLSIIGTPKSLPKKDIGSFEMRLANELMRTLV